MSTLQIANGVHWRYWNDGIAVFVSATCETHVLSPLLLPIFQADHYAFLELAEEASAISSPEREILSSGLQAIIDQLRGLKIIEVTE